MQIAIEDMSVVIQGNIERKTIKKVLRSIRKNLRGAEIVLSTWIGTDVEGLDYDILVLNSDPGNAVYDYANRVVNNCNRQLQSTQNGLKAATRKYTLKLRSDLNVLGKGFLKYWDEFLEADNEYRLFQHKVLVSSVYAREYSDETGLPTPFHPSDFWFFGLTSDLKEYFLETPMMGRDALGCYSYKYPNRVPYTTACWQFPPEQYFCVSYVRRKYQSIEFTDLSDWNEQIIKLSNCILYSNFVFLGVAQSDIVSVKKHRFFMRFDMLLPGLITFDKFKQRYEEYCRHEKKDINQELEREKFLFYRWRLIKRIRIVGSFFKDIFRIVRYCFFKF